MECCIWWHRCDVLKCLLCLWKALWTNECELLATPPYKRCICARQRKGPSSVMGDGASACGMWCLGERAGAEQMHSVYLANQTYWLPADMFTQQLNIKIHLFLSNWGLSFKVSFSVIVKVDEKKIIGWSVCTAFFSPSLSICLSAYFSVCIFCFPPPSFPCLSVSAL